MQQKLVRVDRELHRKAKAYASLKQASLKELTETALAEYMQRNPDPGQAA
jgi:predicted HicB family RNase H-like nuclease